MFVLATLQKFQETINSVKSMKTCSSCGIEAKNFAVARALENTINFICGLTLIPSSALERNY